MKEQREAKKDSLSYFPISNQVIKDSLDGQDTEHLSELGISETLLFMIRQGYATKLRSDVFEILSEALNCNISAGLK